MRKSLIRKGLVLGIIVLFVGVSVIPSTVGINEEKQSSSENKTSFMGFNSRGNILYVGGNGTGNYSKIQDAINNASHGDTVFVYNGTYYENVIINKTINLTGENRNNTIIDGGGIGDVVYISAEKVNISRFTIQNSGNSGYPDCDSGIKIKSEYNNISSNLIKNNCRGIWIHANNNTIADNYVTLSTNQGIEIYLSRNNTIVGNNVSSNTKAGIQSDGSSNNIITSNIVTSNNWHGIFIDDHSNSNTIIGNNISSHDTGIYIHDFSDSNIIYHNNLINNIQNAYDDEANTWDNGYPSGGNYWDDYTGEDADGDGIGDTPYDIPGGSNQDLHPLMHLWGEMPPVANFTYEINGMTVTFNPFSSYDRDGFITTMGWCFGDDPYYVEGPPKIVNHTYEQPGTYNVSLKVIDDDGLYDWMTIQIEIEAEYEFVTTLLIGRITNLTTEGDVITFEAVNLRAITFSPFSFNPYTSGEVVTISKDYFGLVGARFIIVLCSASIED